MRLLVRAFRNAVSQAAHLKSVPFREFIENGLEDILEEAEANDWPAKQIAGQFLARCCVKAEMSPYSFQAGFMAVITFLKDQLGPLGQGEQQAFTDLAKILNNPGDLLGIMGWLNTHYP